MSRSSFYPIVLSLLLISSVPLCKVEAQRRVVSAPAGAKVTQLPEGAEKVTIGDEIYYEHYGTLFKAVETDQGFVYIISGTLQD